MITRLLEQQLHTNKKKLANLLKAVESGIGFETIVPRIKEIEADNELLDRELKLLKGLSINQAMIRDTASEAAMFMCSFKEKMVAAPILEQKLMLKRMLRESPLTVRKT